jgi:hypothetical protein
VARIAERRLPNGVSAGLDANDESSAANLRGGVVAVFAECIAEEDPDPSLEIGRVAAAAAVERAATVDPRTAFRLAGFDPGAKSRTLRKNVCTSTIPRPADRIVSTASAAPCAPAMPRARPVLVSIVSAHLRKTSLGLNRREGIAFL